MPKYDIAMKVLMQQCRDTIIQQLLGIDVASSELIDELPQETVSIKTSDYSVMMGDREGNKRIVLIEVQTR